MEKMVAETVERLFFGPRVVGIMWTAFAAVDVDVRIL